ncbi:hypothetical protein AGMMS49975_19720 [Clostridia bacterium]|nr:hypothetical protein AGMMS49975_19720 [Clostridia bacterium]
MANIQPRKNKDGKVISYSIRVYKGRDSKTGKQLKPYTTTWEVPPNWSDKRAEKEAQKQAAIFEKNCKDGVAVNDRQTFENYANYVVKMKNRAGIKYLDETRHEMLTGRIFPAIGHMKLSEIRPQHLI